MVIDHPLSHLFIDSQPITQPLPGYGSAGACRQRLKKVQFGQGQLDDLIIPDQAAVILVDGPFPDPQIVRGRLFG